MKSDEDKAKDTESEMVNGCSSEDVAAYDKLLMHAMQHVGNGAGSDAPRDIAGWYADFAMYTVLFRRKALKKLGKGAVDR